MAGRVIVLNGASSSGKTSIARALQELLAPQPWLTLGIDTLIGALPLWLGGAGGGLDLRPDGSIRVGPAFGPLEDAWHRGLAAIVGAGANVIVDDVFLGGAESQGRLRAALSGVDVLWVGVHCSAVEAARREAARGDRVPGQAAHQTGIVHVGVTYDLELDTTDLDPATAAQRIATALAAP